MTKEIQVVTKYPGLPAEIQTIENTLESLQKAVGGDIEYVGGLFPYPTGLYCNAVGKLDGLSPNIVLPNGDFVAGPVIVVSADEYGNEISLTDSQANRAVNLLNSLGKYFIGVDLNGTDSNSSDSDPSN